MSRGYFNPSIKRIPPSTVAYNNSIKNAAKQKSVTKRSDQIPGGRKAWDK